MPKCFYCLEEKEESAFNKEHVVPQAFGHFDSETPTLVNCVCAECNTFFAKELDPILSRDTYEGVVRYKQGLKSTEARPQNRLKFTIPDTEEFGEFRGARMWLDGTSNLLQMFSQVGFLNTETGVREFLTDCEIKGMEVFPDHLSIKDYRIIGTNRDNHDTLVQMLIEKKWIKEYIQKSEFTDVSLPEKFKPMIHGSVDTKVRRALAKVGMNFVAKYVGVEEIMKSRWDNAREFVRYGTSEVGSRVSNKPFWGTETKNLRIGSKENPDDIINIRVENQKEGIVVIIEFFHIFTHEILLVENEMLDENQEIAYAFFQGQKPQVGKKIIGIPLTR